MSGPVFYDIDRRTFVILSREGTYYHLVHPAAPDDRRVLNGLVTAGILVCDGCAGGRYRGTCHAVDEAEFDLRAAGQSIVADWIAPSDTPLGLEDDLAGAEAEA
jgi:hypothetical protein